MRQTAHGILGLGPTDTNTDTTNSTIMIITNATLPPSPVDDTGINAMPTLLATVVYERKERLQRRRLHAAFPLELDY